MRHATGARYLLQEESVNQIVGTVPQSFAVTKLDGRHREMHLVNEISVEKLAHCGDAATESHVLAIGRLERLRECVLRRRIEKMECGVPQDY